MQPNAAESRYLQRQIAYARPIFLVLAVVDLLELKHVGGDDLPFVFLLGYLIFALVVISAEELFRKGGWHLPLVVDLAALIVFLFISPSEVAIWFPYLFVAFAAGIRWGLHRAIVLAGAVSLALVVRVAIHGVVHWPAMISWTALAVGTFAGGVGYLLGGFGAPLRWNSLEGSGEGFGWDRRDARKLTTLPRLPHTSQEGLHVLSLATATFDHSGQPAGRIVLINFAHKVTQQELRWFETVVRHLGPSLENLFLLRHMRARAIEAERSRISRDLHDGILQTLLSVEIQLDVLRRQAATTPEHAAAGIAGLQQTVRNESAELRHLVTDLRPVRVQSADLVDLMHGFAERYRNDAGIALDLLITSDGLLAPDRVCRELFQIYREALNNIKKHARASHVVVKLWQDDSRVILVVDDNGEGFSFAGRFTGDELDRLRLGPISIKEHARTVGGVLTVESSPGHGARLTIEVPLG